MLQAIEWIHLGAVSVAAIIGAGAIAQVIWAVGRTLPAEYRLGSPVGAAGLIAGLLLMYATGLLTA